MEKDISCPLALFTILLVGLALASGEDASTTNTKLTGSSVCRVDETSRGEEERAIVERQSAAPLKQSADSVEDDAASTQQSAKVDVASPQESADSAEQGSASPQESSDSAKKQGAEVAKEEPASASESESEWKKCISCDDGKCKACGGSGKYFSVITVTCKVCRGTGKCVVCNGEARFPANVSQNYIYHFECVSCRRKGYCEYCSGSGEADWDRGKPCDMCNGLGICGSCSGAGEIFMRNGRTLNDKDAPGDSTFTPPRYESYVASESCDRCSGTGRCSACRGVRGMNPQFSCEYCNNSLHCDKCGGDGLIEKTKTRRAY